MAIVLWQIDTDTFRRFVAIHDDLQNHLIERPEAVDRLRSLPGFPANFDPLQDEVHIQIRPPKPTSIIHRQLSQSPGAPLIHTSRPLD